uniref:Putative tick transposon n=1 Tax=Rhipicephalus microplus TaxID=6941 RepID=A0A6G5ACZ0_RHIMP
MEINFSKTTFTHITKKKSVLAYDYKIRNSLLTRTHSFKYLGVTITSDLGWHTHVEEVCSKAYRKLFYLRKNSNMLLEMSNYFHIRHLLALFWSMRLLYGVLISSH